MKKYLIYLIIVIVLGFGFYKKIYMPKHTFKTTTVSKGDMSVAINGVGNVGAKNIYKIGSIYGGKVLNLSINEGDFIKKGDLIATVDYVDLKDKVAEQKANIKKLHSDIKSLTLDKQSAITQYNYQNSIFNKNKKLFKRKAISALDFEKYKTNKDVAKLQVASVQAKIDSLYNQIEQLKSNTKGLEAKLKRYTINSPIDGYITKKLITNFQIINPNQNIIEVVNPKDVWIETHIDTRKSGEINIGDVANIQLRSSKSKVKGIVVNIKPINNSVTNEREIDVAFDKLHIPFYLDEQAIVDIKVKQLTNIIKVPLTALTIFKEKTGVWIIKNQVINFKPLKILAYGNKFAATNDLNLNVLLALPDPKKKSFSEDMKILTEKVK